MYHYKGGNFSTDSFLVSSLCIPYTFTTFEHNVTLPNVAVQNAAHF